MKPVSLSLVNSPRSGSVRGGLWRRLWLGAAVVSAACTPATAPRPEAKTPRAIPLDARVSSPSLVWLEAPAPQQGARQTVRHFFDAIAREAGPELDALFTEDALFHRPNQPATPAVIAWHRRLSAGDYTRQVIPSDVGVQLLDQTASAELADHRNVQLQLQNGEVLAVVALPPMMPPGTGLWGTELQLVLTAHEGQWRIRELWEDYVAR